jgi:hypothetical protein
MWPGSGLAWVSATCSGVIGETAAAVLVVGVLLPAVWSGKPARRGAAARAVLEILLRLVEGFRRS